MSGPFPSDLSQWSHLRHDDPQVPLNYKAGLGGARYDREEFNGRRIARDELFEVGNQPNWFHVIGTVDRADQPLARDKRFMAWAQAAPALVERGAQHVGLLATGYRLDSQLTGMELVQDFADIARDEALLAGPRGNEASVREKVYPLRPNIATLEQKIPAGLPGVILAGTYPDEPVKTFLPSAWGALISDYRSGAPDDYSSIVYDIRGDELSDVHLSRLSTALRVGREYPNLLGPEPILAFVASESPRGAGFFNVWFGGHSGGGSTPRPVTGPGAGIDDLPTDAPVNEAFVATQDGAHTLMSWEQFGPFHPGAGKRDKHYFGDDNDGAPYTSGHLWTNTYFYKDRVRDAPLDFELPYHPPCAEGIYPIQGHLRYDPNVKHQWANKQVEGLWRVHVRVMISTPEREDPPELEEPPQPPEESPPSRPITGPGGGSGGGSGGAGGAAGGSGGSGYWVHQWTPAGSQWQWVGQGAPPGPPPGPPAAPPAPAGQKGAKKPGGGGGGGAGKNQGPSGGRAKNSAKEKREEARRARERNEREFRLKKEARRKARGERLRKLRESWKRKKEELKKQKEERKKQREADRRSAKEARDAARKVKPAPKERADAPKAPQVPDTPGMVVPAMSTVPYDGDGLGRQPGTTSNSLGTSSPGFGAYDGQVSAYDSHALYGLPPAASVFTGAALARNSAIAAVAVMEPESVYPLVYAPVDGRAERYNSATLRPADVRLRSGATHAAATTPAELAAPSIMFHAVPMVNTTPSWDRFDVSRDNDSAGFVGSPITGHLQGFGREGRAGWQYAHRPQFMGGNSLWKSGDARGGVAFLPPEVQLDDSVPFRTSGLSSQLLLIHPVNRLGFGDLNSETKAIKTGYEWEDHTKTSGCLTLTPYTDGSVDYTKNLKLGEYTLPLADGNANDVLVTDGAGSVSWAAAGGGGEANTASNVGAGVGVFQSKVGVDLQFHSLVGIDGAVAIGITDVGDTIEIAGTLGWPLNAPETGTAYSFDNTTSGSNLAGMAYDADTAQGPALIDNTGATQLRVTQAGVEVPNKLTVGGLIDPTGLELTPVAANPGGTAANTLWLDSGDSNALKWGANKLATQGFVSGGYQPLDSELTALAGLTSAADKLPYFTGSGTAALANFSAFGRTLIDDADAQTALGTLFAGASSLTSQTNPETDDILVINDSGNAEQLSLANLFKVVNNFTAESSPAYNDVLSLYDASASSADKVTVADLLGSSRCKTVDYTGSGSSGKTVTLTGINRAHYLVVCNLRNIGRTAVAYFPAGATGTPLGRRWDGNPEQTWMSLDAPAAGTAQVLTINTTDVTVNENTYTHRILVIGTPT